MAAEAAISTLSISNAVRRYKSRKALDEVTLSVDGGEVFGLVGRNGAGKSTLVKAAVGALALDSGSVRVLGLDPFRHRDARRVIGVAPQEIALYGHLTIVENLQVFASLAGVPGVLQKQAVASAMADAGCAERANERLDRLSGGWRRRANLAAAVVHRPKLLILDEPTEGLDAEIKLLLQTLVERLRAERTAILLISHDADTVGALSDRIGILNEGRLVAEGSPAELMARAFNGRQELCVRLTGGCGTARPLLEASGLSKSGPGELWTGVTPSAVDVARKLDQSLRAMGVGVDELTVRNPGLDSLIAWAVGTVEA